MNVAVIGASDKPHRYSYKAVQLLQEKGHRVFPVHPRVKTVRGIPVYPSFSEIPEDIDTITFYVGAEKSTAMSEDILERAVRRLIFNPGAENPDLGSRAREKGIEVLEACTLVMLRTNQF